MSCQLTIATLHYPQGPTLRLLSTACSEAPGCEALATAAICGDAAATLQLQTITAKPSKIKVALYPYGCNYAPDSKWLHFNQKRKPAPTEEISSICLCSEDR